MWVEVGVGVGCARRPPSQASRHPTTTLPGRTCASLNMTMKEGRQRATTSTKSPSALEGELGSALLAPLTASLRQSEGAGGAALGVAGQGQGQGGDQVQRVPCSALQGPRCRCAHPSGLRLAPHPPTQHSSAAHARTSRAPTGR